ncbi:hypothetical protein L2E82_12650 [Cichorium intybus]|uniref:Uncharacterized protein n=1 Tax=Cichorium intybus TaxID=13427 RepID=A0ACB9GGN1_CICIN|nr:hypothetical protein L2E82_12650 [Cichorium intybus]
MASRAAEWTEVRRRKSVVKHRREEDTTFFDEDGVSDTWMAEDDDECEEGEIPRAETCRQPMSTRKVSDGLPPETNMNNQEPETAEVTGKANTQPLGPGQTAEVQRSHGEHTRTLGAAKTVEEIPSREDEPSQQENREEEENMQEINVDDDVACDNVDAHNSPLIQKSTGLINDLVPSGCFGPFPSQFQLVHDEALGLGNCEIATSGRKRRKCEIREPLSFPIPMFTLSSPTGATIPAPSLHRPPENDWNIPHSNPPSIDLNRCTEQSSADVESEISSASMEARKTMEVGKALGFDIELENPILQEVMGEAGEHTGLEGCKCNTCKVWGCLMDCRKTKAPFLITFFSLNGRSVFNSRFSEII